MQAPEILPDTDPRLRLKSESVTEFDTRLRVLVQQMKAAMLSRNGLGLAAIQIGEPLRVILVREDTHHLIVMVNPVITRTLKREDISKEGCLSIPPHKWKPVARPAKCDVTWQDTDGETYSATFTGITARCVQHEIDHLEGILMTDHPTARIVR